MSVADYILRELDPDADGFAERFRGASPAIDTALHYLAFDERDLTDGERQLWTRVWSGHTCIRNGSTGHVEVARSCIQALRTLRDYDRMDRAMTAAACELSRLRRRLIELRARPDELRALVSRWRSAASHADGGSSDSVWTASIALEECADELHQVLSARPDEPGRLDFIRVDDGRTR